MNEIRKFYDINDQSVHPCMRGARYSGPMDKVVMSANLADFQAVMQKYQIPFFITFGTLLGAVREHDFIDYDTDVDVGILNPEVHYLKMKKVKEDLVSLEETCGDIGEETSRARDDGCSFEEYALISWTKSLATASSFSFPTLSLRSLRFSASSRLLPIAIALKLDFPSISKVLGSRKNSVK